MSILRKKIKGIIGELIVRIVLGKNKEFEKYTINNIILPDGKGGSKQIDHIHINENGVFVIETKNWSGTVWGNKYKEYWHCNKQKYYNPIKQNLGHVSLIEKLLNIKGVKSLIVFIEGDISNISEDNVIKITKLKTVINTENEIRITPREIKLYYDKIIKIKQNANISEKEHIKNVKSKQKQDILGNNLNTRY